MASAKRQLALPLPRQRAGRPRLKRAKRDFSATEFARALVRNGFQQAAGGLFFIDTRNADAKWIEGVCRPDHIRLARRATLAKILRSREQTGNRVESTTEIIEDFREHESNRGALKGELSD